MSQLRSPIRKYSIVSESSFPIKVSKGEKIPIGESGGLYQLYGSLEKRGFMKAAVSRECPLSELALYKITWSLGDTKFSSRVLKIFTRPLRSLMKKNFLSPRGYVICAVFLR